MTVSTLEFTSGTARVEVSKWYPAQGNSLDTWIRHASHQNEAKIKSLAHGIRFAFIVHKPKNVSAKETASEPRGPHGHMIHACHQNGNTDLVRIIKVTAPLTVFGEGKVFYNKLMPALTRNCGITGLDAPDKTSRSNKSVRPDKATRPDMRGLRTKPGQGIRPAQLQNVLYRWHQGFGSYISFNENIYVLLQDHSGIKNPRIPISELDMAKSRQKQPELWFEWRVQGETYQIRDQRAGAWQDIEGKGNALGPIKKNKRYNGNYKFAKASGVLFGPTTTRFQNYRLRPDGTYETSKQSVSDSGDLWDGLDGKVASSSRCSKEGGQTSVFTKSGDNSVSGTKPNAKCGSANTGHYIVDGYLIEFQADDGAVYRVPFYETGDNSIIINGRGFRIRK